MRLLRPVDPQHDRVHPPDPARERWRESYYFFFYDFRHRVGVCSSIGYRPSKGYSGSMHYAWGEGLPNLVAMEKGRFDEHVDVHDVAGLEYVPGEPFGAWTVRFDGRLNDGGAGVAAHLDAMTDVGSFGGVRQEVSYDLRFEPDQPAYLYREDPAWDGLFDGHVDEVGRVTGTMTIGGRTIDFDGRGAKDHSWGVRDWARPRGWRWVDMLFEDGAEVTLWRVTFDDGSAWTADGAIFHDGVADPVTDFRESVTWAPRERADRPGAWDFLIGSARHRLRGTAEIVGVVPMLFPIRDADGNRAVMWNDRAVYRCRLEDGREGFGSAEFQFRVPESGAAPRPFTAAAP
jgi:hypothetical protein